MKTRNRSAVPILVALALALGMGCFLSTAGGFYWFTRHYLNKIDEAATFSPDDSPADGKK